jgi:peptidoglycan hydrolase-like protein with peptidoglycan-binding domain
MPELSLSVGMYGDEVKLLHSKLRQHGFDIPATEVDRQFFGPATREAVREYQQEHGLPLTGAVDEHTHAAIEEATAARPASPAASASTSPVAGEPAPRVAGSQPPQPTPPPSQPNATDPEQHRVEGRIFFDNGMPATDVAIRLYSRGFGGADTRLGEITTDEQGSYALPYDPGGKAANLEVRIVEAEGEEIPLCATKYNAGKQEVLNLVAPVSVRPLAAEYQRLTADLDQQLGGLDKLADACENADRQDFTVLNRAAGWDARLIALAATAVNLGADPEVGLSQEALYGLFRAGLPTDKLQLALLSAEAVDQALAKAREAGIVGLSDQQVAEVKARFEIFARETRLAMPAPGSRSTYGDLLESAEVDAEARRKFANVYFNQQVFTHVVAADTEYYLTGPQQAHPPDGTLTAGTKITLLEEAGSYCRIRSEDGIEAYVSTDSLQPLDRGNGVQLWNEARAADIIEDDIQTLQRHGKLAFLTLNSAAMISRLQQDMGISDPAQVVDQDLFRADQWGAEINTLADIPAEAGADLTEEQKNRLGAVIPPAYEGDTVEARRSAYAEDMARKVRLSYPTQVIGRMIQRDAADDFKLGETRSSVATFLTNAAPQGFRLGQTPVEAFARAHPDLLDGDGANAIETTKQSVKTLQRVYQITPSNEAMPALLGLGLNSAYDVVATPQEEFLDSYGDQFTSLEEARLVYRKAQQVSSVTYNLITTARKLDSEVPVYGLSGSVEERARVKDELIKQFPTVESLIGSMDFCECEHCRSVLSPAAYLVDLLQFVDAEPLVWGKFLADWQGKHNGHAYAGEYTLNGQKYMGKYEKPYDALIKRRPDIPYIQLTCENTNTALPYIDVVNEILEYYVANDKLTQDAAHDTGDATTAELLAEPQNVIAEAYDKLRLARYPLTLPFDLWLETVRSFCDYSEAPLWQLLETFRPSDALFAPAQPYDRSNIFTESLGINPAEYDIITDPDPLDERKWCELYGYTAAGPAIKDPTNTTNATVSIPDADAVRFQEGDVCTYFDVSADALHTETKTISAIGAPESGGAGQTTITLAGVWYSAPVAGDLFIVDAPAALKSAKVLSRRLGVTYRELDEIVRSGFVNPKLDNLVILYKLGMTIQDVLFYKDRKSFYEENRYLLEEDRSALSAADELSNDDWRDLSELQAFERRLEDLTEEHASAGFDTKTWLNKALDSKAFDDILVLVDPDAGCDFDQTTLRYASGRAADDIAFLRINLFVRLWRKLGWTIEELDRALQTFVPKNTPFDRVHLDKQPLKSALLSLAHLKALDERVGLGKDSRLKLITLWSTMATTGKDPLYAQLFLTRSVLKNNAVFDDPLGEYLSPTGLAAMAQSRKHAVQLENVAPTDKIDPAPFAGRPKITLRYDDLYQVQHLTYEGVLTDADKTQLSPLSPSPALPKLLDAVQVKAKEFTRIKGHLLALQGALSLTADEIGRILKDAGKSIDAELSLPHVTLLYRYGLLAKALTLSVRELISLKQLSGLDLFEPVSDDPVTKLEEDYPFTQTLRFVEVAEQVKESGLRIEDLDYLLRHRFDQVGKYRPNSEAMLALLKALAEGIRAIRAEHAVPDDPSTMDEEMLRQKLGLVLPADVVERFLAMMNGTAEFTATKADVQPEDQLNPTTFADEPSVQQVSYNSTLQEQKLTFRGVLFDPEKNALMGKLPKPVAPNPHVPSPLLGELLDDVQAQARAFFIKHLQKQAPDVQLAAGFLDAADFDLLFAPAPANLNEEQTQERVRQQRTRLAQAFLPFLQQRLIRQFIVQTLTAQTGADPTVVESLLTDARLLGDSEPAGAPQPLLAAFTATGERGLTATFFDSPDGSGKALVTSAFADADTGSKDKDGNPLKPAGAKSARFEGYLEVLVPGAYRFNVALDKQTAEAELPEAELRFDHLPQPSLGGTPANDGAEVSYYLELKPGVPYRFTLALRKLNGGKARLLVQSETLPKGSLAQLTLYPLTAIERGEHALVLLNKALQLIQSLNLNEREVRYLLTHPDDFDNLNLSKLPTRESDDSPAGARALFNQFLRLAGYARLKRDLAGGTDDLIGIFEATALAEVYPLIAKLTRRDEATVRATANALPTTPAFANDLDVQRLWEALQVVERFGVSVASIVAWTPIVSVAATPDQRFTIARDLKEAIKARFEPEAWQRVAQSIFDRLRQRQRDSLASHVMHQHGFARMEQLYEYFLIDPGMEPVVQTSRIRLAISSVQLFIQRCLLNLEKQVHPSAVNARRWEWMRRYRVWEANRKIFLFPENWLEPEFRDDKTHLFRELEGNLLQGDVSSDSVEDAFLNYLKKLDELARLDIVVMHLEDKADPALNTLHVIGRTYSEPHKYFYRRYAHQMWTPWEPVTAEIKGDHLAPVVWRDRLYLFWVTFLEKADPNAMLPVDPKEGGKDKTIAESKVSEVTNSVKGIVANKVVEAQLHWSEYLEGKWSTHESGGSTASLSTTVPLDFDRREVYIHVSKRYEDEEERGVKIHLGGPFRRAFYLAGRNSIPEEVDWELPAFDLWWYYRDLDDPDETFSPPPFRYRGHDSLRTGRRIKAQFILQKVGQYTLLPPNGLMGVWSDIAIASAPLFYQDDLHTLFVEPTLTERTIEYWQQWVTAPPEPRPARIRPDGSEDLLKPMIPRPELPIPIDSIDPDSRFEVRPRQDWLINPATGLLFDGELIGPGGRAGLAVLPSDEAAGARVDGAMPVNIHAGSDLALSKTVVATANNALEQAGLTPVAGRLNVVGSSGFTSALAQNFDVLSRSGFGADNLGVGLTGR